jgi:hypothetical protein
MDQQVSLVYPHENRRGAWWAAFPLGSVYQRGRRLLPLEASTKPLKSLPADNRNPISQVIRFQRSGTVRPSNTYPWVGEKIAGPLFFDGVS